MSKNAAKESCMPKSLHSDRASPVMALTPATCMLKETDPNICRAGADEGQQESVAPH
jgi:hypothetical protein